MTTGHYWLVKTLHSRIAREANPNPFFLTCTPSHGLELMQNDPLRCHELKYPDLSYPYLFPLILSGDMYLPLTGKAVISTRPLRWSGNARAKGLAWHHSVRAHSRE